MTPGDFDLYVTTVVGALVVLMFSYWLFVKD
jgi:hypothetical protein